MKKAFDGLLIRKKLRWLMVMNAGLMTVLMCLFLLLSGQTFRQDMFRQICAMFFLSCAWTWFLSSELQKILTDWLHEHDAMRKTVFGQKECSLRTDQKPENESRISAEGFNEMPAQMQNRDKQPEQQRNHPEETVNAFAIAYREPEHGIFPAESKQHAPKPLENKEFPEENASGDLSCTSVRILLVEDNPVNRFVAQKILEPLACAVDTASDGIQGVEMFFRTVYDVVFMDCQLPKMDGYMATAEIRKYERENFPRRHTPIIALTAHAEEEDKMLCLAAGMDDFITKPFFPEHLVSALKKWCPHKKKEALTVSEAAVRKNPVLPVSAENGASVQNKLDTSEQSVDITVLNTIRSLQRKGKPDILKKVLSHYLEYTPNLLDKLEKAVAEGNGKAISETAHSMKSGSGNAGAMPLFELCRKMEAIGRGAEGNTDTADSVFTEIRSEYEKVERFLRKEMEKQT